MQLSRLVQVANLLRDEYYRLNISDIIQQASNLSANRPSYQLPQYRAQAQQIRQAAENIIENNRLKHLPEDLLRPIQNGRLSALLPERIGRMILASIPDSDPSDAAASPEINLYLKQANFVLEQVNGFISFANAFGIEHYQASPENVSIELSIPRSSFDNELDRLGNQLIEFEKLAEPVSELLSGHRSSPKLLYITTSDPIFILEWLPAAAVSMLFFYKELLGLAASTINISRTLRILASSGTNESTMQEVKKQLESALEKQTSAVVERAAQNRAKNIDEGRANELRKEIEVHARVFVNDLAKGTRITINIDTFDNEKLDNGEFKSANGIEKTTELVESAKKLGDSLWSAAEDIAGKIEQIAHQPED